MSHSGLRWESIAMDETQHGEASPGSTAYERGRFTVQDYPALPQTPRRTPSVSNNAAAAEAMAMAPQVRAV
jgi:hypothetical protein